MKSWKSECSSGSKTQSFLLICQPTIVVDQASNQFSGQSRFLEIRISVFKCYFLKREYLKIGNLGVKNILQALIFVLLAQKSWNFTVTCILSYWRTSACQIWVVLCFSFLLGEKGFFGITPRCRGFSHKKEGTSFKFFCSKHCFNTFI